MKKNILKRLLPFVLALVLVAGLVPRFAVEADAEGNPTAEKDGYTVILEHFSYQANSIEIKSLDVTSDKILVTIYVQHGDAGSELTLKFPNKSCLEPLSAAIFDESESLTIMLKITRAAQASHTVGTPATCTTKAICDICKKEYGEVDPTVHSWGAWTTNDITHSRTCTMHSDVIDSGNHTTEGGTPATCLTPAICGTCDEAYGTALDHVYWYENEQESNELVQYCDNGCHHRVKAWPTTASESYIYTGSAIEPCTIEYSGEWRGDKPTLSYEDNTDVGIATATLRFGELTDAEQFEITPLNLADASIEVNGWLTSTYNGLSQTIPPLSLTLNGKELVEGTDYTVVTPWPATAKDAGTYTAVLEGIGNFTGEREVNFIITQAQPAVTAPKAKTGLVYTPGTAHELVEAGSTTAGEMQYSTLEDGTYGKYIPVAEDAGTYKVWYKAVVPEDNSNYISSTPASIEVTIAKAVPDYDAPIPVESLVYDGSEKALITAGTSEHGTFQYRLGEDGNWSDSIPTAINGGNYTVYWKLEGDSNHSDAEGSVPVTVDPSPIPLTAADFTFTPPENLTYSGTAKAAKVEVNGKSGVGEITVKYDKDPVNAGVYKVSIDVAAGTNYEAATGLTDDSWTFTITKATPVISWAAAPFTYNGQPQGEAEVTLVNGETYGGTITYTHKKGEAEAAAGLPTDAGTYKVTAAIAEQPNYEAVTAETTIVIQPKAVTPTVVIDPEYFTHDGTAKKPAVKVMDGETEIPAKEYNVAYTDDTTQVGAATVTVSDAEGGNYTISTVSKTYLILPDASALDGVTTENVNSSHQAAIDEIQAAMSGKNVAAASDDARAQWNALAARCIDLENAISNAAAKRAEITDAISDLPEQPKTSDLENIDAILDKYEAIEGNLTAAEKEALEEEIEKLEDLKAAITEANAGLKEVTDGAAALDKDDLDFADKATIRDLLEKVEDMDGNAYLTDAQKQTLADAEAQLEELEDAFAAAEKVEADYLNKLPATVKPGTKESVDAYEAAKKAYNDLGADKSKVDPAAVKKLEDFKTALTDYEITKDEGGKWVKGSSSGLSFTANGYYPHFKGVKIDGKLIDDDYYTDKAGSTIVTLKASYLQKLKSGKHTISILFGDGDYTGEATANFKVTSSATSPATGDPIMTAAVVMIVSMAALACLIAWKKKHST